MSRRVKPVVDVLVYADGFRLEGHTASRMVEPLIEGVRKLFMRLRDGQQCVQVLRGWRVQWCRLRVMDCTRRCVPADDQWMDGGESGIERAA